MKEGTTRPTKKILILTEAGKGIGFGHLTRCLAVRDELKSQGAEAVMVVNLVEMASPDPKVIGLDWIENLSRLDSFKSIDLVLIDSYLASEATYRYLQNTFSKLAVIDDYNRIGYPADYVVNPNVFFEQIDYAIQNAPVDGGKDYVILRSVFRQNVSGGVVRDKIEHILITIGGSDYRNLLPRLIRFCLKQKMTSVKVIDPERLSVPFASSGIEILGGQTAEQMHALMHEADVVMAACGQSLHELASQGRPVIGICLDIDQEPNQRYYVDHGMLKYNIEWNSDMLEEQLSLNLAELEPAKERERLARLEKSLINKDGVSNLSNKLLQLIDD